jgi:flagellar FliJ protein
MARFNFRLQQFLNVKEQIEDQKEIEYGQAIRRLEEEKEKKRRLEQKKENEINAFRKSLQDMIKPPDLRRYNNTIEHIKKKIVEQEKRIEAAQIYAEQKRLELVEAMKERKAMDKVKENAFEAYTRDEMLAEQKQIDELVSYKYTERKAKADI